MKRYIPPTSYCSLLVMMTWFGLSPGARAFPNIINVAETDGDNEATDTVTAKWTGVTFSNGIAGEFLDPFTVPLFGEDVPAYVDRTHQWNGATIDLPLPSYLIGGEYIMIGNDNHYCAATSVYFAKFKWQHTNDRLVGQRQVAAGFNSNRQQQ